MKDTINNLRITFNNKPTKLELLNTMYSILEENHFPDSIEISLQKHYSSSLKKQISNILGYLVPARKIGDTFTIKKYDK